MIEPDYKSLPAEKLRKLCKERKISFCCSANNDILIDMLIDYDYDHNQNQRVTHGNHTRT